MKLYNTLSRTIEEFKPLNPPAVTLYTCGPTVYDFTHLGHMRTYINNDTLKRTLNYLGYKVNHVMNITDVGHLTGDDDSGEDKLEKGAKKTGKTVWDVAKFYTDFFMDTMKELNVIPANTVSAATKHIPEMIDLIKQLEKNGLIYQTDDAVYFDTTKFKGYGILSGQKVEEKKEGAREDVHKDTQKKHPADFAVWFKRVGRFKDHEMHWDSPWGDGFPGWHIECSAMSIKYLGETIDIHTGGIDHIPVHHENEIAQSEGATGKKFVRFWVHQNFLMVNGQKMSKSLENIFTINDVKEKGIDPLSLRLLFLQTHYRQVMNFTWESAQGAHEAYQKLKDFVIILRQQNNRTTLSDEKLEKVDEYRKRFNESVANDLQTPQAVAVMWEMIKSNIPSEDKLDLLLEFDQVLGFNLANATHEEIPNEVKQLAELRQQKRTEKKFEETDKLRNEIEEKGYIVEDSTDGYRIKKK